MSPPRTNKNACSNIPLVSGCETGPYLEETLKPEIDSASKEKRAAQFE